MRLSSLTDYAVVLLCSAARSCGACDAGGVRVSAADLSGRTGISLPTAQKLVTMLCRAGLLVSARGVGGGVRLARPAAAISIADVVEAIEGPIALTACMDEQRNDCVLEHNCAVQPHWGPVNRAVRDALDGVTLASLLDAQPSKIEAMA